MMQGFFITGLHTPACTHTHSDNATALLAHPLAIAHTDAWDTHD